MAVNTNAQIPNSGFEIWEDYTDNYSHYVYDKPDLWVGELPNNLANSFSISKYPESYPAGTGQSSMKIQADLENGVRGIASSYDRIFDMNSSVPKPSFAIDYKPTSLFLYYKCSPVGGDTVICSVYFYKDGALIGNTFFGTTETVTEWTPLEIPMTYDNSEIPDSATIVFLTGVYAPHSGSTWYVDNLSFTGYVTSVPEQTTDKSFISSNFNPASDFLMLNPGNRNNANLELSIYNMTGQLVKSELVKPTQQQVNIKDIDNGIYVLVIKSRTRIEKKKLIVQR